MHLGFKRDIQLIRATKLKRILNLNIRKWMIT